MIEQNPIGNGLLGRPMVKWEWEDVVKIKDLDALGGGPNWKILTTE